MGPGFDNDALSIAVARWADLPTGTPRALSKPPTFLKRAANCHARKAPHPDVCCSSSSLRHKAASTADPRGRATPCHADCDVQTWGFAVIICVMGRMSCYGGLVAVD